MTNTWRESGAPGLRIYGKASWGYRLYWQPEGAEKAVAVLESPRNRFGTVRDAKAAADRLSVLLRPGFDATEWRTVEKHDELRHFLIEGLTGRPIADLQREAEAERLRQLAWYTGEGARDRAETEAQRTGHAMTWHKSGQRSWRGGCRGCGVECRVSYRSHSRSYSTTWHPIYDRCAA